MLRMNRQGFTLIELMVVIVIIGVLASLAIPRFSEASAKAKVAEAPRVLASWESAFLASEVELSIDELKALKKDDIIFDAPTSKWFDYKPESGEGGNAANDGSALKAEARSNMSTFTSGGWIKAQYDFERAMSVDTTGGKSDTTAGVTQGFKHCTNVKSAAKRFVPNFALTEECSN